MDKTKHILVFTAWYPSPNRPLATTFVRDQTEMFQKYFNIFETHYAYSFAVLHVAHPIDLFNYIIRGKRTERVKEYDGHGKIPVIHKQPLILSHRIKINQKKNINNR